jgi:hypothetical protein
MTAGTWLWNRSQLYVLVIHPTKSSDKIIAGQNHVITSATTDSRGRVRQVASMPVIISLSNIRRPFFTIRDLLITE